MTGVIARHKIIVLFLGILICAALAWLIISRQNAAKTPLRGVFVMEQCASLNEDL